MVWSVGARFRMWWHDLGWGLWNGLTAWIVLIAQIFDFLEDQPFYDSNRDGTWYNLGFLLGAGSPMLGWFRRK